MSSTTHDRHLPDISIVTVAPFAAPLSRVGMEKIEMPLKLEGLTVPARIDAYVSLDKGEARGIHMSRLYLEIAETFSEQTLTWGVLKSLLQKFLTRHEGLSQTAEIAVRFELPVERNGLLSRERGFRLYPVTLRAVSNKLRTHFYVTSEILYSSTCPCSASLARELMRAQFVEAQSKGKVLQVDQVADWLVSDDVEIATPHAQRSLAKVTVDLDLAKVSDSFGPTEVLKLIDGIELALGTPVQAAVKRVDEQEFARLNGENLMFCEDAARKLRAALDSVTEYFDYSIYVEHQESLHPHSAVAKVVKGVAGGLVAT